MLRRELERHVEHRKLKREASEACRNLLAGIFGRPIHVDYAECCKGRFFSVVECKGFYEKYKGCVLEEYVHHIGNYAHNRYSKKSPVNDSGDHPH
jgi:hypothetical protein